VKILISLVWHVKVDDDVDSLNIDTSSEKIGADHDSVLALFELLEYSESLAHLHVSATGNTWELLLLDDVVQFLSILVCFREDDHLVEMELVKDVHQLFDLLVFFELDEVLLQTVEVQFSLTFDDEFVRLLHVESANFLGGFRQGGREHHDLQALLGRILRHEDFLDLLPHGGLIEHLVALVQNEMLQVIQLQNWILWWGAAEGLDSTWSTYYDMRGSFLVFQNLLILLDWYTAEKDLLSNVWEILRESVCLLLDLVGQLSRVTQNEGGCWLGVIIELLQDRQDEHSGLTETGYSLAEDITAVVGLGDALLLDL
jgi:hypothetical protein